MLPRVNKSGPKGKSLLKCVAPIPPSINPNTYKDIHDETLEGDFINLFSIAQGGGDTRKEREMENEMSSLGL